MLLFHLCQCCEKKTHIRNLREMIALTTAEQLRAPLDIDIISAQVLTVLQIRRGNRDNRDNNPHFGSNEGSKHMFC